MKTTYQGPPNWGKSEDGWIQEALRLAQTMVAAFKVSLDDSRCTDHQLSGEAALLPLVSGVSKLPVPITQMAPRNSQVPSYLPTKLNAGLH